MASLKEMGRKPNGMKCRLSCGCVKTIIVEVPFDNEHSTEQIPGPSNLNRAYKAVVEKQGRGGIDKMSCEQLLMAQDPQVLLIRSLMDGSYRP